MKKDLAIIFGLFFVIVALLAFGRGLTSVGFIDNESQGQTNVRQSGVVSVTSKTMAVNAKVAAKADERKKGLSKIESMPLNEGMIFVFEEKGNYAFWMKDVKFALDIIWIGEDKKIVDIAFSAVPEPGKGDEELTLYRPRAEAWYVLEVNAGLAVLHGLQIGDPINFEIN